VRPIAEQAGKVPLQVAPTIAGVRGSFPQFSSILPDFPYSESAQEPRMTAGSAVPIICALMHCDRDSDNRQWLTGYSFSFKSSFLNPDLIKSRTLEFQSVLVLALRRVKFESFKKRPGRRGQWQSPANYF
jgi:hypothetical protein